MYTSDIENR